MSDNQHPPLTREDHAALSLLGECHGLSKQEMALLVMVARLTGIGVAAACYEYVAACDARNGANELADYKSRVAYRLTPRSTWKPVPEVRSQRPRGEYGSVSLREWMESRATNS